MLGHKSVDIKCKSDKFPRIPQKPYPIEVEKDSVPIVTIRILCRENIIQRATKRCPAYKKTTSF